MKFFFTAFFIQLKRFLRLPGTLVCFLLPFLVVALGLFLPQEQQTTNAVEVGLYYSPEADTGGLAEEMVATLQANPLGDNGKGDPVPIYFFKASTQQELEENVASGRWECGYLLPDDFNRRIEAGEYRNIITRVSSPATSMGELIDDAVLGALLEVSAPVIAKSYLARTGLVTLDVNDPAFDAMAQEFFAGQPLTQVDVQWINEPSPEKKNPIVVFSIQSFLRGIIALVALLFGCMSLARFGEDLRSIFFERMHSYCGRISLFAPPFFATAALSLLSAYLSLVLANLFFPGIMQGSLWELGWLAVYQIYIFAIILLLGSLFHNKDVILAITPFLMVACFVFCPLIVDISSFFPLAQYIALVLPPTLYIQAAAGDINMVWLMLALSLVFTLIAILILWIKGRRSSLVKVYAER